MKLRVISAVVALAGLATGASAQWSDGFEGYSVGSNLHGQGGWKGWDNDPAHAGTASDSFARTGSNSARISTPSSTAYGDDLTHEYSGYTTGQWNYTAYQYISSNTPSGAGRNTYFILMNTYDDGAAGTTDRWSLQLKFDLSTNTVYDDALSAAGSPGTAFLAIVRDAWVEISVDIDLDANTMLARYNGAVVLNTSWTRGTAGAQQAIEAVDLYSSTTGPVFYDDLSLTRVPAPGALGVLALGGLMAGRRRRA